MNCIFCKIVKSEIPAARVFENERFLAFRDIQAQAKTHLLVIPKEHIVSLDDAFSKEDATRTQLMGEMLQVATQVARQEKLLPNGFRLVLNSGAQAGQTVFHIHAHVMGGEPLKGRFGA